MKKICITMLALMLATTTFTACSSDEPFATASADDDPRIIDPLFADGKDGQRPVIANISRDASLNIKLTVTPAQHTNITWLLDGQQVATGNEINQQLLAGTYLLRIDLTTTQGKQTFREGWVHVKPLPTDPTSASAGSERIVAPGTTGLLYGTNLDKVTAISIGQTPATNVQYVAAQQSLSYDVPANTPPGEYRLTLADAQGNVYGADKVLVTNQALATNTTYRATAGAMFTLQGVNLDKVASITIGETTITAFQTQTAARLSFTCPALADGSYTLSGKTKAGEELAFYNANGNTNKQSIIISGEQTLWSGRHYVSWELPDGNPNKTFNLISKEQMANLTPGTTLRIAYTLKTDDAYHQLQLCSARWTLLPGTSKIDLTGDGIHEVTLTKAMLDLIQAEDGFICAGHGFYVTAVTAK